MPLIVFDLDLTLWDCGKSLWCDCTTPPYRKMPDGTAKDSHNTTIRLYPDVRDILSHLDSQDVTLALASRTSAPDQAQQLLDLFDLSSHFPLQQIYPGDKKAHFRALHDDTGLGYEEMVFFDDEPRNTESVKELGVETIHTPHGLNWEKLNSSNFALQ